MAHDTRQLRLRIATPGAADVDGNVDVTLTAEVGEVPTIRGPVIEPLEGRSISRPWSVSVVDQANVLASAIRDSGGRLDELLRLADVQQAVDGGAWETVGTGRIVEVVEEERPGWMTVTLQDERHVESGTDIFTVANSVALFPPGRVVPYRFYPQVIPATLRTVGTVVVDSVTFADFLVEVRPHSRPATQQVIDDMDGDARQFRTGVGGNFRHTRMHLVSTGLDYPISHFTDVHPNFEVPTTHIVSAPMTDGRGFGPRVFVEWSGSAPTPGQLFTRDAWFWQPTAAPTDVAPLLIGGAAGVQPFELVEQIYALDFGGEIEVRIDPTTLQAMQDDLRFGRFHFRITDVANMRAFLEDEIYGPLGVVPIPGRNGRLKMVSILLPNAAGLDPDTLKIITKSVATRHPGWRHTSRDLVTRLVYKGEIERRLVGFQPPLPNEEDAVADGVEVREREIVREHDRIATLGAHERTVSLVGSRRQLTDANTLGNQYQSSVPEIEYLADLLSQEVFDRYGDGPIYGAFAALESGVDVTADLLAGDYVKLQLDHFLNPEETDGRGGTRIVQVLARDDGPEGPAFEYVDVGPALQPLSTPTVTLTQNATRPEHFVDLAVGNLTAGYRLNVMVALTAAGAGAPALTASVWQPRIIWVVVSGTTHNVTLGPFPSNAGVHVTARVSLPHRIRSGWATVDSVDTDALSAPTTLVNDVVGGSFVAGSWTLGETTYQVEVGLDEAVLASSDPVVIARLEAGSVSHRIEGLEVSTTYTWAVRHVDLYGGSSAWAKKEVTTSGTLPTAPQLRGDGITPILYDPS